MRMILKFLNWIASFFKKKQNQDDFYDDAIRFYGDIKRYAYRGPDGVLQIDSAPKKRHGERAYFAAFRKEDYSYKSWAVAKSKKEARAIFEKALKDRGIKIKPTMRKS